MCVTAIPLYSWAIASAITAGLLHTQMGTKTSIIQQLEHQISISSCMHLSCHHKDIFLYLFLCFIYHWVLEAMIINSRHHECLSLCMTSRGFSLYVLILIWSSHHSGLLSQKNPLHVINHYSKLLYESLELQRWKATKYAIAVSYSQMFVWN